MYDFHLMSFILGALVVGGPAILKCIKLKEKLNDCKEELWQWRISNKG